MKQIKIVIERSRDHYSAYAESIEGIYGAGDTIEHTKQSILKAIKLIKEYNDPVNIPLVLKKEHQLIYK